MSTFLGMPLGRVPGPAADTAVGHLTGDRTFPEEAREALADTRLRRNLGHATSTIRAKRAAVVGEVPDWEALRSAGSAIKADTMARLPELLEQLEAAVIARGGVVHWARDAAEANRVVVDLVRATGASEVVKVKSMATQEIGLNEALEAAGITAHETDLAELIVQLGHDRPSHILVPAIHRGRAEIRDIFAREMPGVDASALTDEPAVLAAAARSHLREVFLRARVAVSGANFGVAETGTLAVVESEGNGRMCLTLPETLITVMGIEKVVPTWRDLEVFLQLLPRSSTGERMNPYTSTWSGVTPGDGPQEFHLVLLDNGRTRALADDLGRTALHCIRCSACLNVCPVYERTGGHAYGSVYPGPIGAVLTPLLTGVTGEADPNDSLPYASSLCGACYDVCPVKINIPDLLVQLRAEHTEAHAAHHRVPTAEAAAMAAAAWVMGDATRFARAGRAAGTARHG
ncbi:(4Fe-4S) protein, partial [Intrasporangium oryzae NRRL B-24470]